MQNLGDDDVFHKGVSDNQRNKSTTRGFPPDVAMAVSTKKHRPSALSLSTSNNIILQRIDGQTSVSTPGMDKEMNFMFGGVDNPTTQSKSGESSSTPGLPKHMHSYSLLTPTIGTIQTFTFPPSSEEALIKDIEETFQKLESVLVPPAPGLIFEPIFYNVEAINALFLAWAKPGCRLDVIDLVKHLTELFGQFSQLPLAKEKYFKEMPLAGTIVLAPYKNDDGVDEWFRGLVVRTCDDKVHCEVLYSDFGNSATLQYDNLMLCPPSLATIPPVTVLCRLAGLGYGFQPKQADTILDAFRGIISAEQGRNGLTGRGNGNWSEEVFEIELTFRHGKDLIQENMEALGRIIPPGKVPNRHGRDIIPPGVRVVRVRALVWNSPLEFYAWPDLLQNEDKVKARMRQISEVLAGHFSANQFSVPQEGCFVAVYVSSHYYRAVVVAVSYVTKAATVRLIDGGLELSVPFHHISRLEQTDLHEVLLAAKFCVSWADENWARIPVHLGKSDKKNPLLDCVEHFQFQEGLEYEIKVEIVHRAGEKDENDVERGEEVVEALMKIPTDINKENGKMETSTV